MHSYIKPLVRSFEQNRNPVNAVPMSKYMRDQFEFLGIKSPERRGLAAQFFREYDYPELAELNEVSRSLWRLPEREYQYFAVDLLDKEVKQLTEDFIDLCEDLVITKSWWDTVDGIATHLVGGLLQKYPNLLSVYVPKWRRSDNIWLRRTALLFQLNYKANTDVDLLFTLIRENVESTEFFIQKAIGWVLRQYSKTDSQAVLQFVEQNELAPLSRREALKWLNSKKRS